MRISDWSSDVCSSDLFMGSRPVRVGNAAAEQFQLDVYGEVADALAQALKGGLPRHPRTHALSEVVMPFLEEAWRRPDEGIWEVRGGRQHFTHSKLMVWVAFDRPANLAAAVDGGHALSVRWSRVAGALTDTWCRRGSDPALGRSVPGPASALKG